MSIPSPGAPGADAPAPQASGLDGARGLCGVALGHSRWVEVDQGLVDAFGALTGDRHWMHTDPGRARAESPFGATIAHGYLTFVLGIGLLAEVVRIDGIALKLNYGTNKVRFPAPLPVGSRVRLGATVLDVVDVDEGVADVVLGVTVEADGAERPACAAELVFRYFERHPDLPPVAGAAEGVDR